MPELSKKLLEEMNVQIQEELFSAYLYYAIGAWFDSINLPGFAHWMRVQALEEVTHAHKFHNHIVGRRGTVEFLEIKKPPKKWESALDACEAAFKHEQHITGRIHILLDIAVKEGDHEAIYGILNWFIEEQIEEEQNTDALVQKLKMLADSKNALYMLDREVATRMFTPPVWLTY